MSDLTTPRGVLALMESSRSLDEWNRNCARVADANAGRPEAARKSIGRVLTGPLYARTAARFGDA